MPPRVLITDDNAFMRLILRHLLEKHEYTVIGEAGDGHQAVEFYREWQPDLTFMDINMPGISGIEAVKEIIRFDPEARIVMVSAMGQKYFIRDALNAGAKDFVIKPFQPEQVLAVAARVLGTK
ncbi:MAG: response regulator [Firmicutes bacterium]|nr:response regulator [Bacillota bacterium]